MLKTLRGAATAALFAGLCLLSACGAVPMAATGAGAAATGASVASQLAGGVATANSAISQAHDVAVMICAGLPLLDAAAKSTMTLAKLPQADLDNEAKAVQSAAALCANLPADVTGILPSLIAVEASVKSNVAAATPAAAKAQ